MPMNYTWWLAPNEYSERSDKSECLPTMKHLAMWPARKADLASEGDELSV